MKKILIIHTTAFPTGKVETFLENEMLYYDKFDRVFFIPFNIEPGRRDISDYPNVSFIELPNYSLMAKVLYCIYSLFTKLLWSELFWLIRSHRLSIPTMRHAISMLTRTYYYVYATEKELKKRISGYQESELFFYSYWFVEHALAACLLKKKFHAKKAVSRCHRYDLYEERDSYLYIPFRNYLLNNLDAIYPISDDGKKYIETRYGKRSNIWVSRLGTTDHGYKAGFERNDTLRIVSCSWVVPVKRVDRIVDALSQIEDVKIVWHHVGGGALLKDVEQYARKKLGKKQNIIYFFDGDVSNEELMQYYINHDIDVFVNVSESEGIPVSIMEAISFGIIPVATRVGGVSEIIIDGKTGYLLDKNYHDTDLIKRLRLVQTMPFEQHAQFRAGVRAFWQVNYHAAINYKSFINMIIDEESC